MYAKIVRMADIMFSGSEMVDVLGMCNAQAVPVGGGRGAAGARRVQGTGGPGEAAQAGHGAHCAL